VFAEPERLSRNLDRVLAHFASAPLTLPELVAASDARNWHVDDHGEWWRLWLYRVHTRTLAAPVSEAETYVAARAFGCFQRQMQNFPAPQLEPAIPGFLELELYLQALDRISAGGDSARISAADRQFIDAHRFLAARFPRGSEYVHGDCKLDNLLFAEEGAIVDSVLDLDTVMPGHWAWDFGDLVRSLLTLQSSPAVGVPFDKPLAPVLFAAAARGFIDGRGENLALEDLLVAPCYVSFMLGVRFLADHLSGDVYFKVASAGDNLRRAQQQFAIVSELERQAPALRTRLQQLRGVIC
jgi:hypothetical protein